MRMKILGLLFAPLLLLTGCGDETVTAPQVALDEVVSANQAVSGYDLLALDGPGTQTTGVNDAGTVVGRKLVGHEVVNERSEGEEWEAALWTGGGVTLVGGPRSSFGGINNEGAGFGWESDSASSNFAIHRRGFIYRNAEVVPISGEHLDEYGEFGETFFTGSLDRDRVQPWDMNDHGVVVARALFQREDEKWRRYALVWQEGSAITYLRGGQPTAINNHGDIIGFGWFSVGPVLWVKGSYDEPRVIEALQHHFPDHQIELRSINDSGQILGIACKRNDDRSQCDGAAYDRRGFVLNDGTVVDLPLPRHAVDLFSLGALNENGRVAGTIRKREGPDTNYVPAVWTVNTTGASFQELPRNGHRHALATAINNLDQVAGHLNPWEALLWTPAADDGGDEGECTHPKGKCK